MRGLYAGVLASSRSTGAPAALITPTEQNVYLLNNTSCLASTSTQEMLDLVGDMDFHRGSGSGAGSDDPSIVGTAGADGIYFGFDGGDQLNTKDITVGFMNNIHRPIANGGTEAITIIMAIQSPSSSVIGTLCSSVDDTNDELDTGMNILFENDRTFTRFYQNETTKNDYSDTSYPSIGLSTDMIVVYSVDYNDNITTNKMFVYKSGSFSDTMTLAEQSAIAWTGKNTDPTTTFKIGSSGSSPLPIPSGFRLYGACFADTALSESECLTAAQNMETALGITF